MINKIILASKSEVREKIFKHNGISCEVIPANIDEDQVKKSLLKEGVLPDLISKNLAELKSLTSVPSIDTVPPKIFPGG